VRLSEERIAHLSHLIIRKLGEAKLIEPLQSDEKLYRDVKRTIVAELTVEDEVDQFVRDKIRSLSRKVPEGSPEWGVLYRKYMEEEMRRKKRL
jgi:hypothetical protein